MLEVFDAGKSIKWVLSRQDTFATMSESIPRYAYLAQGPPLILRLREGVLIWNMKLPQSLKIMSDK